MIEHDIYIYSLSSQVQVLTAHNQRVGDLWVAAQKMADLPASDLLHHGVYEFLDEQKEILKPMETDLRDGKHRISLAKGPRKNKSKPQGELHEASSAGELEGSGEE